MQASLDSSSQSAKFAAYLPLIGELFRYGLVAVTALAVDAGTLALLTTVLKVHYLWGGAIGFLLGLVTNYVLSIRWVFKRRSTSSRSAEFMLFAGIGVIGLILTQVLLWVGTGLMGIPVMLSKAFAVALVFFVNFGARKVLLFK